MVDTAAAFDNTATIQPQPSVAPVPQQQQATTEQPQPQVSPTSASTPPVDESKLDLSSLEPVQQQQNAPQVDESKLDLSSLEPASPDNTTMSTQATGKPNNVVEAFKAALQDAGRDMVEPIARAGAIIRGEKTFDWREDTLPMLLAFMPEMAGKDSAMADLLETRINNLKSKIGEGTGNKEFVDRPAPLVNNRMADPQAFDKMQSEQPIPKQAVNNTVEPTINTGHPTRNAFEDQQSTEENTSADMKRQSNIFYSQVDKSTATLPPTLSGTILDSLKLSQGKSAVSIARAQDDPVNQLMTRFEGLGMRNQSLTISDIKNIDEQLGDIASSHYGLKGLDSQGKRALDAQDQLREIVHNSPGNSDLQQARKYWEQGAKLRDIERIQERADLTKNPATAIQTGVRTLLNSKRSRGYSDEERAALTNAAKDGVLGGALHVFGSRLIPIAAGATEAGTGGVGMGFLGAAVAHAGTSAARAGATALKTSKLNSAKDVITKNAPLWLQNSGQ